MECLAFVILLVGRVYLIEEVDVFWKYNVDSSGFVVTF